jgi:outer membrane protein OmpA-like peptidoglycan-associated protein
MSIRILPALAAALLCAATLSGCLTPRVKPQPSQAVLEARARVAVKPPACPVGGPETVSPVDVSFGFDDAVISEVGQQRLAKAAKWLACHPQVEAVILPDADRHGDAAHLADLAGRRAQAALDQLRADGAKANLIRVTARGAPDPLTAPHVVVNAQGRGW